MKRIFRCILPLLLCLSLLVSIPASAEEGMPSILDEAQLQSYIEKYISDHGINPEHLSVGFVYTATGDTWYGESELFGNETAAYQTDSNISFTTSYYSTYIEYSIVTLTLYAVADGNLTKSPVDPGKVKGH